MEDPWNIQSLFELQYFVCPSCAYKNNSKQEFVYHAFNIHPESIEKLKIISDDSLCDVNCPWNEIEIKEEMVFEQSDIIVDTCQNGEILEIKEDCDPLDEIDNKIQNEESTTEGNDHSMPNHMKIWHEGNSNKHKCEQCGNGFSTTTLLKQHIRLVSFIYSSFLAHIKYIQIH